MPSESTPSWHDWPHELWPKHAQLPSFRKQDKRERAKQQRLSELPAQPRGQIVVDCPLPHRDLHPNARASWQAKANRTQAQRRHCADATTLAMRDRTDVRVPIPSATLELIFLGVKHGDDDNLVSWSKSSRDGISDVLNGGQDSCWKIVSVSHEQSREKLLRIIVTPSPLTSPHVPA